MLMMKFILIFFIIANAFLYISCDNGSNLQSTTGNTTISGNGTNAPYGAITGYASTNVPAYSNGNDSYISDDPNYLYEVYMGMKWQCVEYARRWLFIRKGCVFDSVDGAADIWTQIQKIQRVVDGKCFTLKQYPNGSPSPPINESLLIYNRSDNGFPYGHVSVIIDVLPNFIRVAEENYYPYYWSGNYSRQIPYALINGSYYIQTDDPVLGWISIDDSNNQTKPLDQTTINAIIQLNGTSPNFICPNSSISTTTTTGSSPNSSISTTTTGSIINASAAIYHRFSVCFYILFLIHAWYHLITRFCFDN